MTIREEQIERYVRYPHSLSPEEQRDIEAAIQSSDLVRQIAAFYEEFYAELDQGQLPVNGQAKSLSSFIRSRFSTRK